MKDSLLITNIQRFCLSDGPGIRTTCFFKGCSARCPWCCNPENICTIKEKYYDENCVCKTFGEYYSNSDLLEILLKDKSFYNNKGGVTFSGGEALLQFYNFVPVLDSLKERNVNICLETSLFIDNSILIDSIKYFDYYIVDIKILDENKCKTVVGGNLNLFYTNIETLLKSNKSIMLRIPVIKGYTDDYNNKSNIAAFIKNISSSKNIINIELIKGHNLARNKYKYLNTTNNNVVFHEIEDLSDAEIQDYKSLIEKESKNIPVSILKL